MSKLDFTAAIPATSVVKDMRSLRGLLINATRRIYDLQGCSKMPTLRFRDQEIAKYLDASDRLQFLGINEIGV